MNSESRLSRRDFLHLSAAGLAAAGIFLERSGKAFAEAYGKPNFIIFYTDDQGIGDLSAYGAVIARDTGRVTLEVPKAETSRITARLLTDLPISDLTVEVEGKEKVRICCE